MCGPEDPLFTPLLPLSRVPFQAKESVHKTPFRKKIEILASTASIFTQILAHKPPNLEFFSSQAPKFGNFPLTSPPFQRQMSVRKPHTSEIRAAHPYLKKVECPPRAQDIFDLPLTLKINFVPLTENECFKPWTLLIRHRWGMCSLSIKTFLQHQWIITNHETSVCTVSAYSTRQYQSDINSI